jgi:hypothetical protein
MEEDYLEIYNPANARNLSKEQIDALQTLSIKQIAELAKRYPNTARGNAYLVLRDKTARNQIFPLSTFQNLSNLISKQGKKNYSIYTYRELFNRSTGAKQSEIPLGKMQDLTKDEIINAEGVNIDPVIKRKPGRPATKKV